jgi:hypothetical protein
MVRVVSALADGESQSSDPARAALTADCLALYGIHSSCAKLRYVDINLSVNCRCGLTGN